MMPVLATLRSAHRVLRQRSMDVQEDMMATAGAFEIM